MMTDVSTRSAPVGRLDDARTGVNSQRRCSGRGKRGHRRSLAVDSHRSTAADVNLPAATLASRLRGTLGLGLFASTLVLLAGVAAAAQLLAGSMPGGNGTAIDFGLEAEDREAVVGGRILLGETAYEISRLSRLGLIGARRFVPGGDTQEPYAEFLVLSSSFRRADGGRQTVGRRSRVARVRGAVQHLSRPLSSRRRSGGGGARSDSVPGAGGEPLSLARLPGVLLHRASTGLTPAHPSVQRAAGGRIRPPAARFTRRRFDSESRAPELDPRRSPGSVPRGSWR